MLPKGGVEGYKLQYETQQEKRQGVVNDREVTVVAKNCIMATGVYNA